MPPLRTAAPHLACSVSFAYQSLYTQVPAGKVPQWSQVRVPEGLKAPDDVANLFGADVNPLLLLGAVAAIAIPALLFQVQAQQNIAPPEHMRQSGDAHVHSISVLHLCVSRHTVSMANTHT